MKKPHRLFFAIPFDAATKNMYENIRKRLQKKHKDIISVIGNSEIGPSPEYSDIISFKLQNRELTKQFVNQIQEADIIIADLTNNNPNVHVELGIALEKNKNIFRVTGRSVSELGFDIRNLEVRKYNNEDDLIDSIIKYIEIFYRIKNLEISPEHGELYFREPNTLELRAMNARSGIDFKTTCPEEFILRDGGIRTQFNLIEARSDADWFGVYLRVGTNPFIDSHLVYVRKSGHLEIATYPGPKVIEILNLNRIISGINELTIQIENDYIEANIDNVSIKSNKLSYQKAGRIFPAAYCSNVDVMNFEIINRDTIAND